MKYPIVYIKFLDHVSGSLGVLSPYECEVVGVLYKEDKLCYYVATWVCEREWGGDNSDGYVILKSTVTEKRKMRWSK